MKELKATWKRAFRVWAALLLGLAASFIFLLMMFACLFFAIHIFRTITTVDPDAFDRAVGDRFGLTLGISLYLLTIVASVVVVRLVLGRRIGDFRLVLVEANLNPGAARRLGTKDGVCV